eukprot:s4736_g1.t1
MGGCRLLLLLGGICAWSPRLSASSLGFCGRQLSCAPHERVLRRRVADEAQEQQAAIAELTEKFSQQTESDYFEVGQNVSGRVMATQFRGPSLAYVDIGADKDAVLEYGEMEDGFPTKRDPLRKGKQIYARILEFNEESDRFYLTMRSGDLSRPPRIKKSEENHDPESLRLVASEEWLDAEVGLEVVITLPEPPTVRAMASMEDRIKVRILRGLSSRVVTELDMDRRSFVFDVMMAIKQETGLHWRRQRLLYDQQPLGEAQRLGEFIDGPEAEVALVHMDHQKLEPISDRDKLQVMLLSDGEALAYATEEFRRDRDLALAALRQTGKALRHIRGALLADEEIVELAMASHPLALARAAKAARKNPKLAAKALNADPDMIRFLHPDLLGNEAFLMPHIEKNGLLLEHVRRQTSKIAAAAVEQNPLALAFCKAHHITEPMVMTAVAKNGLALRFVPAQFKLRQVVLVAVGQNPRAAKYVGAKALLLDAVRDYPHALKFARSEFLADADVVSMAFETDKTSLRYATKPAVLELKAHEDLLQLAKDSLQEDVDILSAVQALHKAKKDLGDWGTAEATVLGIFTFGVFVNVTPSWGGGDPVFALLPKSEFSADFGSDPEKAIRGGKIKVRKLGLNDRGETAPYGSTCFSSAVIVVGGGLPGMSAANTVVELGGRTILLDKSSFCGGNSTKATSGINGAGTKTQKGKSIPDTAEWLVCFWEFLSRIVSISPLVGLRLDQSRTSSWEAAAMDKFSLMKVARFVVSHQQPRLAWILDPATSEAIVIQKLAAGDLLHKACTSGSQLTKSDKVIKGV